MIYLTILDKDSFICKVAHGEELHSLCCEVYPSAFPTVSLPVRMDSNPSREGIYFASTAATNPLTDGYLSHQCILDYVEVMLVAEFTYVSRKKRG